MGTPAEIQRSLGPQAPQRVQKAPKAATSHYNVKSMACQACYARKKRCVVAASQSRCTYCCREGQDCVPRERQARSQKQESSSSSSSSSSSPASSHGLNLRLPHGIDHAVPRWAAVYSMFSEVLRLIPPEMNDDDIDMKEEKVSSGDIADKAERDRGYAEAVSITNSTSDDVKTYKEPLGSGFSLGELDALLRF